ncbi:MAG: hypothetical protein JWP81_809 [Ferruginibacter sp.]|nr:hypothetical protein [Ferruginibacter sp.]
MQRKSLHLLAGLACIILLFNWGCTKIDSTILGADLIPAVDNVTTFADTLSIDAIREPLIDTTRLNRSETHVLGNISNDPVFGSTKASIFLQLKPTFFPFYFGKAGDTINPAKKASTHFDSAFLCLSFTGFYGDTTKPQHFSVYQLSENTTNFVDTTAHLLNFQPNSPYLGNFLGDTTVYEPDLKNYRFLKTSAKDSVTRQIRIRLNSSFLALLTKGDSSSDKLNNFFNNDSLFKSKFKGFAVVPDGANSGNGLFYVSLTDATTRLEIHYVASNGSALDTAFSSFPLSTGSLLTVSASANANNITRDTSTSIFPNHPDPKALYVQTAPGSAISLKIPALSSYTNRIIHRAEIFLEQVPGGPMDDVLTAPAFLYLDLVADTSSTTKYKPLYYDLSPHEFYNPDNTTTFFPTGGIDQSYYGGYLRSTTDAFGKRSYYTFNLTRYLQNLVTKGGTNYRFRVYAPYNLNYYGYNLTYKNNLAYGRVKLQNDPLSPYRIRMRVVYSKIAP